MVGLLSPVLVDVDEAADVLSQWFSDAADEESVCAWQCVPGSESYDACMGECLGCDGY